MDLLDRLEEKKIKGHTEGLCDRMLQGAWRDGGR